MKSYVNEGGEEKTYLRVDKMSLLAIEAGSIVSSLPPFPPAEKLKPGVMFVMFFVS
jgi:hypothetical protein